MFQTFNERKGKIDKKIYFRILPLIGPDKDIPAPDVAPIPRL